MNPIVRTNGVKLLEEAGVEVDLMENGESMLDARCSMSEKTSLSSLNRRFILNQTSNRTYCIAKWAQTSDGFMAPEDRTQRQISGHFAQALNHKWRTEEDAILVGPGTALADDPQLTSRLWPGRAPVRVLLWPRGLPPAHLKLLNPQNGERTFVLNSEKESREGEVEYIRMDTFEPMQILSVLYQKGIGSVLVEGGAFTLNTFIEAGCVDEYRVFVSPKTWGSGVLAPVINLAPFERLRVGEDWLYQSYLE